MKLSIIVPLYNEENNICQLRKSIYEFILNIKNTDFEVILVNAGSTDNTLVNLKENFKESVFKIKSSERLFPGAARNYGVKHSSGEYLLFIDAGIKYDKNFVLALMNKLEAQNLDVVWGELYRKPQSEFNKILVDLTYSKLRPKVIPTMMIKRKVFFNFREDLRALEDTDFIMKIENMNLKEERVESAKAYYFDFPNYYSEIIKKWITYNEYTIYSGVRKNKEKAAILANFFLIMVCINKKIRKIAPLGLITFTFVKFQRKGIKIFGNTNLDNYVFMSIIIDLCTYFGLTKGLIIRAWRTLKK